MMFGDGCERAARSRCLCVSSARAPRHLHSAPAVAGEQRGTRGSRVPRAAGGLGRSARSVPGWGAGLEATDTTLERRARPRAHGRWSPPVGPGLPYLPTVARRGKALPPGAQPGPGDGGSKAGAGRRVRASGGDRSAGLRGFRAAQGAQGLPAGWGTRRPARGLALPLGGDARLKAGVPTATPSPRTACGGGGRGPASAGGHGGAGKGLGEGGHPR